MRGDLEWVSWMTGGREGRKEGGSERVLPFRASPTTTKTKFIFRRKTLKTTTVTSFSALHIERGRLEIRGTFGQDTRNLNPFPPFLAFLKCGFSIGFGDQHGISYKGRFVSLISPLCPLLSYH